MQCEVAFGQSRIGETGAYNRRALLGHLLAKKTAFTDSKWRARRQIARSNFSLSRLIPVLGAGCLTTSAEALAQTCPEGRHPNRRARS